MRRNYSYHKIATLYKRFQFHASAFVLTIAGLWIAWKISRQPFVPEWMFTILIIWIVALIIEMLRFAYVFKRRKRSK
ncbi:hypothetical protein LZZ85_18415 [Terrimonas sp. NA20]|uniref:2TM domain-containing protein n=1 Tax=Terrimonas ginsenosidimutans TaxID=2908004 RepID=A0ABS9KVA6_9BACT|nr:hypothetical protein [Terrimonas ginsenosidimutans]MCG2616279.1 hypothetical protein [Terrimonas ginsenosidimutans]